jgi:hypothetical protein
MEKMFQMQQKRKVNPYEQIDFAGMVNRYLYKDRTSVGTIEGVYSVSSLITKKGKGLLSSTEKEKVVDRKENYSKVVIIRDSGKREYLEVSLDKDFLPTYSIRGEFTNVADGNILVYKHFEPHGKILTYTFSYDKQHDILEGVRTENDGSFTVTYKLTYLKLLPKSDTPSN